MRAASRTSSTWSSGSSASRGDLLVGRLAAQLRRQVALGADDLALALADVHGDPDRARLVREPALDRLADPEGRVGRELVALAPVELLGRADQAEDALLDQVEQRQLLALVLLRDRDDEPQVRVDHALLRLEVALLDPLGELDLLVGGQQRVAADLVEEELERVGRRGRQLAVAERRSARLRRARSRRVTSMPCDSRWASSASTSSSASSSAWASSSNSERLTQPRSSPRATSAATSGREVSSCATMPNATPPPRPLRRDGRASAAAAARRASGRRRRARRSPPA